MPIYLLKIFILLRTDFIMLYFFYQLFLILNITRRIFNIEESNRGIKVEINDLKIPKSDITLPKKG